MYWFIKVSAIMLVLIANALVLAQSDIIIPMDLSLSRPVIELSINQQGPYKFIVDTGASLHVIDKGLAERLGLKETGKQEVGVPGSDTLIHASQVKIHEMQVSGESFSDVDMVVMGLSDMLPVDGVLSYKMFAHHLLTFDYPQQQLILATGELTKGQKNVIPMITNEEILTVAIQANKQTWKAHLDTGSPFAFNFPVALKDRLEFASPPVALTAQSRTLAGEHQTWRAKLAGPVTLADIQFPMPDIILADRNNAYVNIGFQVLKDLKVTIDQSNQLIRFEKCQAKNKGDAVTLQDDPKGITGRYGGVRSITLENGVYFSQRDGSLKLKLVKVGDNLYEVRLPEGMRAKNVLPKFRFDRDDSRRVIGLTFIYPDGKEEFVKKDEPN